MKLSDCSAVILDMDGLILDTEKTYFCAWRKALEKMGFQVTESFLLSFSGLEYSEVETRLLAVYGHSFEIDRFRKLSSQFWYEVVETNGITTKKGFYGLIDVLKNFNLPYALATNSLKKNALECLTYAGISECFSNNVVTRDLVNLGKPAPDIFIHCASLLNAQIETCVVVEDSEVGVQAAKAAGAYTVYIPSNAAIKAGYADLCLNDLEQLGEIIKDAMLPDRV